jgi:hypothetical protein
MSWSYTIDGFDDTFEHRVEVIKQRLSHPKPTKPAKRSVSDNQDLKPDLKPGPKKRARAEEVQSDSGDESALEDHGPVTFDQGAPAMLKAIVRTLSGRAKPTNESLQLFKSYLVAAVEAAAEKKVERQAVVEKVVQSNDRAMLDVMKRMYVPTGPGEEVPEDNSAYLARLYDPARHGKSFTRHPMCMQPSHETTKRILRVWDRHGTDLCREWFPTWDGQAPPPVTVDMDKRSGDCHKGGCKPRFLGLKWSGETW